MKEVKLKKHNRVNLIDQVKLEKFQSKKIKPIYFFKIEGHFKGIYTKGNN